MGWVLLLIALPLGWLGLWWWRGRQRRQRQDWIDDYPLPPGLLQRVRQTYPALNEQQLALVESGLRQFFRLALAAAPRTVAMPSQAVDELWHQFILYTRNYQQFCQRAFGHYLHHTPAVRMGGPQQQRAAIRRTWQLACREEGINPARPARLPLLFELDALLAIPGGFVYVPDCSTADAPAGSYCGTELGGSDSSSDDCRDSDDSCSDSDSSGDGGGDGGGCGGGGD